VSIIIPEIKAIITNAMNKLKKKAHTSKENGAISPSSNSGNLVKPLSIKPL
jgi:hypothetical protein